MCQVKTWVYISEHWYFLYLSPFDISTVSPDIPECPPPEKPVNGYLLPKYGPNRRLISVNYTCEPPFTLIGSQQRMCLPNAKWSGAVPTCVEGIFSTGRLLAIIFWCSQKRPFVHLLREFVFILNSNENRPNQQSPVFASSQAAQRLPQTSFCQSSRCTDPRVFLQQAVYSERKPSEYLLV